MKKLLRQLVFAGVIGAVAVIAIDGKTALAGPSPKAIKTTAEDLRAIEELEGFALVREKVEQAFDKLRKLFTSSKSTAGETRSVETETDREIARLRLAEQTKATEEAEVARQRQTETRHEVSALYEGIKSDTNLAKQIQQIIEAQERIEIKISAAQNMVNEAVAKLAKAEASGPDSKFGFDTQTGSLTKTWVKRGIKVSVGIPLYAPLEHAGEYVYKCMIVEHNTAKKCIENVFESVRQYVETKLSLPDETLVGPAPVNSVIPLSPIDFRSL